MQDRHLTAPKIVQILLLLYQKFKKNFIITYCLSNFLAACQVHFDRQHLPVKFKFEIRALLKGKQSVPESFVTIFPHYMLLNQHFFPMIYKQTFLFFPEVAKQTIYFPLLTEKCDIKNLI